jgi:hypothetical protein
MPEDDTAAHIGRRRAIVVTAAALTLIPRFARAQDPFQLSYTVERGGTGPARVQGRVRNDGNVDVLDVYVTAEAVDAGGKVLGRGLAFVSSVIPPRVTVAFAISIPAAQTAASFRVRVSSFRQGFGQQTG